jgi:hypothetical protein
LRRARWREEFERREILMLIQGMYLERIIGAVDQWPENLPSIDEDVWIIRGTIADVIYFEAGNGDCAVMHVIPKTETLEVVLKATLAEIPR